MRKFICYLLVVLTLLISGCGIAKIPEAHLTDSTENKSGNTSEPTQISPVYGGELRVPLTSIDTFNPLLTQSRDVLNFLGFIFESAITYDENLKPAPCLVTKWEVSPDGRLWVFYVRKGVKWHDGNSLTGEDILFTLQALQSGVLNSFFNKNNENIKIVESGLRGGDPYTFYIRLEEPTYLVLDYLTFPILSHYVYKSVDYMMENKNNFSILPIGTGPYMVDSTYGYDGETIKLIKNSDWWNGNPYIDSILGKSYASLYQAFDAFYNNEVDLIDTTAVYSNTRLHHSNANHYKYLTSDIELLVLNDSNVLFQDKSVKKAIAYGIDRKDIISKVYLNNAETVDVPIPSKSWLYDSTYRIYDYDVQRAVKLLKEAGWEDSNGDGVLEKDFNGNNVDLSFTILTNSDNGLRVDASNLIAKHLKDIGFQVQVEAFPWDILKEERITKGEYDAVLTGYSLDSMLDLKSLLNSEWISYKSPELDSLLENAVRSYTDEDRLAAYKEIQKYMTEELPLISLYFRTGSLLVDSRVKNVENIDEIGTYKDIKNWFIVP